MRETKKILWTKVFVVILSKLVKTVISSLLEYFLFVNHDELEYEA